MGIITDLIGLSRQGKQQKLAQQYHAEAQKTQQLSRQIGVLQAIMSLPSGTVRPEVQQGAFEQIMNLVGLEGGAAGKQMQGQLGPLGNVLPTLASGAAQEMQPQVQAQAQPQTTDSAAQGPAVPGAQTPADLDAATASYVRQGFPLDQAREMAKISGPNQFYAWEKPSSGWSPRPTPPVTPPSVTAPHGAPATPATLASPTTPQPRAATAPIPATPATLAPVAAAQPTAPPAAPQPTPSVLTEPSLPTRTTGSIFYTPQEQEQIHKHNLWKAEQEKLDTEEQEFRGRQARGLPPSGRARSLKEEERDDALQAKAEELRKPVSQLTGQERLEVDREIEAKKKTEKDLERDDALQAKAEALGKPVEKLTGQEKVDAIREAKAKKTAAMTDDAPPGYQQGSPSVANPNLNPGIEDDAVIGLTTGKWPPVGRAGTALANRQMRTRDRAGEIRVNWGLTAEDVLALQTTTDANKKQFIKINGTDSALNAADTTLNLNAQWAKELSSRFKRGDVQFYNDVLSALKTGTGSDAALNYAGQLHTLAQTWAKILEGGVQSVSGAHVASAAEAGALLSKAMSDHQLDSFIDNVIFKDRDHRKAGVEGEKDRLLGLVRKPETALTGGGGGGAGGPGAAAGGPAPTIDTKAEYDALPSGSRYIDKQDGKTYVKK